MPSSARYSHGSTPRSARVTSPASFRTSNVFRKEALNSLWNNTSPLPGSSDITQGPPPLEIPTKVRFNTSDTRRNTSSSFVSGRGDRSATATNDGGWESPRVAPFPNITSLRIGDALQDYNSGRKAGFYTNAAGHHGEGTAAGEHPSPPVDRISITREGNIHDDELRHSEERAQRFRLASPEVTEVLPFLFVGGEEAAKDRNQLLKKGITAVVNTVHFDLPNFHSDIINYLSLYVSDSPDEPIFSLIYKVVHYIEEQRKLSGGNGKVFVHCHQGVSRSCSFVIAYVMWHKGMCYDEAYEFVRQRRTICSPNAGFFVTLHLWENLLSNRNNFKLMNNQNMANSLQEVGFNYYVNRGYAYTPYSSKYRFPFSFRVAFSLRDASRLESLLKTTQKYLQVEEDDIIHHPVVRFLKPTDVKLEVDERLCYGFLLQRYPSKDKNKSVSYGTNPVYAFLYCGSKVEKIIADQAKVDWASFIQGNFFPGKEVVESKRKNSEVLRFLPAPPIRGPDSNASDITTFVDTPTLTNEIMNKVYDRPVTANPPSIVVGTKLEWVSALMEHEELTFNFGKMLQSELRSKNEEETKARNREAELRQVLSRERYSVSRDRSQSLPNAHPTSPKWPL
ncbi:hypothetical protein AGDE_11072 [Angomonas deanei]|uniref:Dual specificity phosphatase, catalytic domain containing protein, putative n=1 Tax=Angomonas deanei TaxID=59799 RepID=A0A7G2CR63_9TRYP|nr:hypothetical protein AGDE_11072 [Angomonas deanei]CAD2221474.1 Dual specificity phosphatase, catalytic domain containing protein, putative [Angomonas deanei]|eukprot:EPY26826.1 hypothetical protein AGDE_11072 [Angomonas deanei]